MKALIFGAGNLLYADEGFGVHLAKYLDDNYEANPDVEFYDAGTLGMVAQYKFEEADFVIIVDALELDQEPGSVWLYEGEDIKADNIPTKMSPHQIGLQEVLMVTSLRGHSLEDVKLIGVVPESMEMGQMELSETCKAKLPYVCDRINELLKEKGLEIVKKA